MSRFLTILLIPAVLASQGACFSHAHCSQGLSIAAHDARPHVHLGQEDGCHLLSAAHVHRRPTEFRRTNHPGQHSAQSPATAKQSDSEHGHPVGGLVTSPDHSSDAVYCADAKFLGTPQTKVFRRSLAQAACEACWLCLPDASLVASGLAKVLVLPHAPLDPACPIFLRNLSLRC